MSLVEHLQELRRRVIISLLALLTGTVVGFVWYQYAPFGLMPLGEILRGPYCALPPESRASFTLDGECRLLATAPLEMFMLRLKVGALAGMVMASPVWLYQLWAFIVPGLHKKERRATFTFVTLAVLLFIAGAVLAYFIVHFGLEFLLTMGDQTQAAALTGERYFNFLLAFLLIFGVSFEVPLIIVMLNIIGVLEYEAIKEKRRMIILILFIFAAFITPGQDPFSMVVLAVALTLLVEMALQFARWNDKRRDRQRPEWMDLDDEHASPLSTGPGGVDPPAPVGPARPVDAAQPAADRRFDNFDDVL
ncbi:twin-arginine translocase subunit TatC [Corynebacterium sp. YIM 101645]|uniref:Sec-independent protein translocase protein TatC n=1 Tax=Corynebacterium lemuris TaxID=1859292 RepID=A0ABT2FW54_9CORY|nr:twin-arginine translocase subunit TatC [Corynebacterium lemuris]MCS5479474.1 twin-arginine translocase subunit TatC [Corynebacterium lemuris]